MSTPVRHADHAQGVICRPALGIGLCEPLPPQVTVLGQVTDVRGSPLLVGHCGGRLFLDGHELDAGEADALAHLIAAAGWHCERDCPADCGGEVHDQACRGTP